MNPKLIFRIHKLLYQKYYYRFKDFSKIRFKVLFCPLEISHVSLPYLKQLDETNRAKTVLCVFTRQESSKMFDYV